MGPKISWHIPFIPLSTGYCITTLINHIYHCSFISCYNIFFIIAVKNKQKMLIINYRRLSLKILFSFLNQPLNQKKLNYYICLNKLNKVSYIYDIYLIVYIKLCELLIENAWACCVRNINGSVFLCQVPPCLPEHKMVCTLSVLLIMVMSG